MTTPEKAPKQKAAARLKRDATADVGPDRVVRTRKAKAEAIDTDLLSLDDRRIHEPQRLAVSHGGMVATAHHGATSAGVEVLEAGGNAFDAAVAAAFALGVVEPAASGLGGQTFLQFYDVAAGRTVALDGSSRAPNRATLDAFADGSSARRRGYRATTVPSTPAVLDYVRESYGTLPLADLLRPAIRLAEEGYEVSLLQHALAARELPWLRRATGAAIFLRNGRLAYRAGSLFRQPALAGTLRRLAESGVTDFYQGDIAAAIDADMVAHDGLLRLDDLAQIPQPIERRPLTGRFFGHRVFTMPPPGAGRTLIEMMNIHQQLPEDRRNIDTLSGGVLLAETIRRAFLDRSDRPFDPNFYSQVSEKQMLRVDYAQDLADEMAQRFFGRGGGETTHLSVMDRAGNVVALTQSIENVYGSCEACPTLGFLYNNYMNAFEYDDLTHPYALRPNAVPWASVAPTIVFRGRRPWLAIGSPGSERITPSILQVVIRLLQGAGPLDAVTAPRLYCSLKRQVSLEASRMRDDLPRALERRGFTVDAREPYSFYLGCVQFVMRNRDEFIGVADPRRDGATGGPRPGRVPAAAAG
ncbi:MAG: gamma-glutamyltransferase [Acidobacteria bacterium]|nr:gamma-glutamyltransferase [Acidobacteriota bacterium]